MGRKAAAGRRRQSIAAFEARAPEWLQGRPVFAMISCDDVVIAVHSLREAEGGGKGADAA
jgi:hypothetical protein